MINGLTWLLVFQLAGEVLVRVTGVPVPGAVVGMLLLLGALVVVRPPATAGIFQASIGILRHLQLFFVPAGVGVIVYLRTIGDDLLPITVALLVSWVVGLLVVGGTIQLWIGRRATGPNDSGLAGES